MRWVIKTGSATLSKPEGGLERSSIERLAAQIAGLKEKGEDVILVSSGAIAAGVGRLGWKERPRDLRMKQSAAAVGQLALMEAYEAAFSQFKLTPAQILLTREDLMNKQRRLNLRHTILTLLSLNTVPIINENDSVSTEEIQFGDNDTLSATVATKVDADRLVLLSDVPGLYEVDAHGKLTSTIIREVKRVTPRMEKQASSASGSKLSVGGIATKLKAAKMANAAGIETWLASGLDGTVLERIQKSDETAGTRFASAKKSSKKK